VAQDLQLELSSELRLTATVTVTASDISSDTSYRKAHALPPSCPDYYADLI
jgi:hypothetical protein